jgi:hypothetical protein
MNKYIKRLNNQIHKNIKININIFIPINKELINKNKYWAVYTIMINQLILKEISLIISYINLMKL